MPYNMVSFPYTVCTVTIGLKKYLYMLMYCHHLRNVTKSNHKMPNDMVWVYANLKLCVTGSIYIENYTCTLIQL